MSKQWFVTFYSKGVKDHIAKLPKGILAKYARLTTIMESYGPDIGMPHTKHMGKCLKEI